MPSESSAADLPLWRRLYASAGEIFALAPWKSLQEDQLFAIRDPDTGSLAACSVMGALGDHLAIAFYLGGEGMSTFLHARRDDCTERERLNAMLLCPHLQVSFENRTDLDLRDRRLVKELGLRYRGAQTWPRFRAHHAARYPWHLTAPEARQLDTFLEQALHVLTHLSPQDLPAVETAKALPLRSFEPSKGWTDGRIRLDEFPPPSLHHLEYVIPDGAFDGLPRSSMTVEIDMSLIPMPVADGSKDDPAPQFPLMVLMADSRSGAVLGIEMLSTRPAYGGCLQQLPEILTKLILSAGLLPKSITARHPLLLTFLEILGKEGGGWSVRQNADLPAIDQAFDSFESQAIGGNF